MKTSPSPHRKQSDPHERRRAVLRIFEDEGWGSLELVSDWSGEDLEELRALLRPAEFEMLLDRLKDQEDSRR